MKRIDFEYKSIDLIKGDQVIKNIKMLSNVVKYINNFKEFNIFSLVKNLPN